MAVSTTNLTDTTGIQLKDAFVVIVKTECPCGGRFGRRRYKKVGRKWRGF
jgi:hypothetical protein